MRRSDNFTRWIEGNALGLRQLNAVDPLERLVPREFAEALRYHVCFPHEIEGLSVMDLDQLVSVDPSGWSGSSAVLPDGRAAVILNPTDALSRNNITIMEELAHDYLGHAPSLSAGGNAPLKYRSFNRSQEKQAYALGAACVLPARRLQLLLDTGATVAQIARAEELSERVVIYRLHVSGVGRAA